MRKLKLEELNRISAEDFKSAPKIPLVLVLDNIRSMHNVGAAFRTADAFSVEKIYLCGVTATPPHRDIHKSALGAEDTIPWEYQKSTAVLLTKLKQEGYIIVAVEQTDSSIMLHDFKPVSDAKYAFVFGNEVFGVEEEALELADFSLEIPQTGTKHSLNVSVTLGIVIWDYVGKQLLSKTL